jgi:hypothetical protein
VTEGRAMVEKGAARVRIVGLLAEMALVVFAVLMALAVEEWREERRLVDFADRVRAAVLAELDANLGELRRTGEPLSELQTILGEVVSAQDLSVMGDDLQLNLPDLSTAAWEVAQGSEAAPYLEYEWLIDIARAYEVLDVYSEASSNVIASMAALVGRTPTVEHISDVYGWLAIINDVHGQAESRLEEVLAASSD